MSIILIVACDPDGIIGKQGTLPWRMPEDLRMFRKRTLGHAIVMGKNTWNSLPKKPLDFRANIVISRSYWGPPQGRDGPYFYTAIKEAIAAVRETWHSNDINEYSHRDIFIIGGAQIYNQALAEGVVDKIIMSKIKKSYGGDVYFPSLNGKFWKVDEVSHHDGFDVVSFVKETVDAGKH